ncbi:conserved hypothetical protein [Shewanella sediminis HAW-EB3]|uniref:Uncharacterized protein n=1 Tax=Shewanella sediminis (strain HAW-EB3) TaxID=425104 RepID=A8FPL5_SHESH|nr:hypothetical protein [Shewanella sediminis]ABV34788.1 conserved hypothetical protein [Shewanella sediminis HAW-EB3]
MLVVTNYPQVPIATTNAATDSARTDNQQRPPVIPPKELTKGHEERSFTPQHERTAEQADAQARLNERVQGKQQGTGQQHQEGKQQDQAKHAAPLLIKDLLRGKPALQRRDIQTSQQAVSPTPQKTDNERAIILDQPSEFYREFGQRVESFYQQQTHPHDEPAISALI